MSLDDAMRVGEAHSPRLAAQQFAVSAAREQVTRATELPDPKLKFGIENLPVTGPDQYRYDRDSMTMRSFGLMQDFPNGDKRAARGQRAEAARLVEKATLDSQRVFLHRDIAQAWLEVHFAERMRQTLEKLAGQLDAQAEASSAALARGRQSGADALMLRSAAEQARDRMLESERGIARARIGLAALIGEGDARRPLASGPDLDRLAVAREALLARLHEHPHLRVYEQRQELAKADVDVARASRGSDWSVEVGYGVRKPAFDNMLTVMVAMDLPWQRERRQDRDVASKVAELEQSRAMREDARRMHEAEMRSWLADFDTAGARLQRYRDRQLPLARDRYEAALAAYRGGRGELNPVLEAARAATDVELAFIALEAERAKAWANLSYLYPHEVHK
jgi:outer membrane protein TolC